MRAPRSKKGRLRRLFRRQTQVCREGWYYLAIVAIVFGGAVFKEVNLLLILGGMLLGPLVLNWRGVTTMLRGLQLQRQLPPRLGAGDMLAVNLHLVNPRRRLGSWAVVVEERIEQLAGEGCNGPARQPPLKPRVLFPYVRAGSSGKGAYRGRLDRRGRYRFGPVQISTRFPFGLFSRTMTIGPAEELIVLPRLGRLTEGWVARRSEAFVGMDRRRRQAGPEGDFFGVREWRSGDGQRLIHWRSSARLGKLVVRQFERPRSRDVALVLDLWQPAVPTPPQLAAVERAVCFAATVLADLCHKAGSNVYLGLENSGPECSGGPASPATLQGMLERLAVVEARSQSAIAALLAHALRQVTAETEIVLVSTRPLNPADMPELTPLRPDAALRERLRRIRAIDASSDQLAEYYQAE
jgi:uncharacterized protein (DUF58 family)